jgi:hypothetical protein
MSEAHMTPEGGSKGTLPEKKIEPAKKKSWTQNAAVRIGAALFVLAGLGFGVKKGIDSSSNNPPPIHQTIETPSPTVFDPTARESTADANNSVQMTLADYEKTSPSPLWENENKTLTTLLPVMFRDGRIPTLHIEKTQNPKAEGALDLITIDGLEQGDILFSPIDGEIEIYKGDNNLTDFYLIAKDFQGQNVGISIMTTGLNPLITFDHNPTGYKTTQSIKKGDPIGSFLTSNKHWAYNGQLKMDGDAPLLDDDFILATTPDGKLIEIKQP